MCVCVWHFLQAVWYQLQTFDTSLPPYCLHYKILFVAAKKSSNCLFTSQREDGRTGYKRKVFFVLKKCMFLFQPPFFSLNTNLGLWYPTSFHFNLSAFFSGLLLQQNTPFLVELKVLCSDNFLAKKETFSPKIVPRLESDITCCRRPTTKRRNGNKKLISHL